MVPESTKIERGSQWKENDNQTVFQHLLTFSKEYFLCETKRREKSAPIVFLSDPRSLTAEAPGVLDHTCSPKKE